ncbi:hypothetical protein [Streptomyces sp. NPDC006415]|uniref:hypothetical protein n=1 Tax=Streptomyces sp. NPDC006415 TaxID=3155351 RepID=UPI0033A762B2
MAQRAGAQRHRNAADGLDVGDVAPEDVGRMRAEMFEVISRYRHSQADAPRGAVPVSLQVQAFPVPGTVDLDAEVGGI